MRDIYNMIIRRALSEVKKKIRPRPPGGSRFGFKPGPGSRAGGKGFVPVHECRTAGRCDLFGGQLMLTGLQADIGIQLCRGGVGLLQSGHAYGVLVDDVRDLAHNVSLLP